MMLIWNADDGDTNYWHSDDNGGTTITTKAMLMMIIIKTLMS
jgi:hypothetical protein